MRRHRRGYLSGLFFNTGNYDERTVSESLGFTRQFSDTINQGMMDDERIELEHRKAEELRKRAEAERRPENPAPEPPEME